MAGPSVAFLTFYPQIPPGDRKRAGQAPQIPCRNAVSLRSNQKGNASQVQVSLCVRKTDRLRRELGRGTAKGRTVPAHSLCLGGSRWCCSEPLAESRILREGESRDHTLRQCPWGLGCAESLSLVGVGGVHLLLCLISRLQAPQIQPSMIPLCHEVLGRRKLLSGPWALAGLGVSLPSVQGLYPPEIPLRTHGRILGD